MPRNSVGEIGWQPLRVEGAVRTPRSLGFGDLAALPGQIPDVGALVANRQGGAVAFRSLLDSVGVSPNATQVLLESLDGGFSQEAPLASLQTAVLVYRLGDAPLPAELGGPVRFLIPNVEECAGGVDRCTNVKALGRVHVS
jgi:DMSO/TMAO reductase YedYZ molybdopterin-dependent catalytic subunit